MMYKIKQLLTNRRHFSSTKHKLVNDQDILIEEVRSLEEEFNEVDRDVEELSQHVQESEEGINSEDETELSQFVGQRVKDKDDLVGQSMTDKDVALFEENNVRKDHSLTLDMIEESTQKDIDTLTQIKEQIPELDPAHEKASELLERLEKLESKTSELQNKWHMNDLPPIVENSSNNKNSPQDSSDIYQTDFSSFDPFDE